MKLQPPRWIAEPQWLRPPMDPLPSTREEARIRLVTLNVAHGRKHATHQAFLRPQTVRENLEEVGEVLRRVDADVAALQEADGPSAWSGNFDHVELLRENGGFQDHFRGDHNPFGFGNANLASGTALMSKSPLRSPRSHRFDTSWRDTKGFVVAGIDAPWDPDGQIDVVSVHFEPFVRSLRGRQIRQLTRLLAGRSRPLVVLGDFNCSWMEDAEYFRPLVDRLNLRTYQPYRKAPTYPAKRPWRRLDWILISPELEFEAYHTLENPVSDHLGVFAEVRLRSVQEEAERDLSDVAV